MKQINIGILGLGTVGGGTFTILQRNAALIAQRTGCELRVTKIATRTPQKAAQWQAPSEIVSTDVESLLRDPEIHIVAELIGGIEPARTYILEAFKNKKSVVTANKELLAKHGAEIRAAAEEAGVDLLIEGAVGGGIPLIKPLRESLAGNEIKQLMGIVNGTTNFILTKMTRENSDFAEVLAEAQSLGYAEADPTADVEAFDAAYKLSILAGIAFDTPLDPNTDIYREGITKVSAKDIDYAAELGYIIKLIALARKTESGELELRVHPTLIPKNHPLSSVNDAFNALFLTGDAVGDLMFYGRGAGDLPTGSAVVGDIIEAAKNICRGVKNVDFAPREKARVASFDSHSTRFCVRMQVEDKPGTIAKIASAFGDAGVSIESIVQRNTENGVAEIFWMTHATTQSALNNAIAAWNELEVVQHLSSVLRVEGE
jgi:homoserine dehydrogenase